MHKWDYGGLKPYDIDKAVKSLKALVNMKSDAGSAVTQNAGTLIYTCGDKSYMVQNKPINYALLEKNPDKFYDTIINEEIMVVKCHIKRKKKWFDAEDIKIEEKLSKRHIGARVDAVIAAIEAANV